MLLHTFQHIKGISARKERLLWESGIISWDSYDSVRFRQLSLFGREESNNYFYESRHAFETGNIEFFAKKLKKHEHYRIALSFPKQTVFLDIETTGLSLYYDTITLVGWSAGTEYDLYIKGRSKKALRKALLGAKAIVTFNGSLFDLPFLKKEFPDIPLPLAHIDLRFFAKRVGLSGGQKLIEKAIGFERCSDLKELEGKLAPILWHKYRRGDIDALKLLISYNHADIEGLKHIFDASIDRLIKQKEIPLSIPIKHKFSSERSTILWPNGKPKQTKAIWLMPYKGKIGTSIQLKNLPLQKFPLKVVGIDLTGSEQRPSGWCLLDGDRAFTKRINTDKEIIAETLKTNPFLISIDSPLSLPQGRVVVSDEDLGRHTYGITRYCERALKKRGVNVYPCLIKSMQNLTARGIKLATAFRKMGIPVIESYPGAAQDIMNIPRKRADEALLKAGLSEFGIKGDYITTLVSHDELDAITSAVVGLFFLSGKFEALGNEEEDYLIIPNLQQAENYWKGFVVGISGNIASGKTTAGKFLETKGYAYGRFSLVLKDILQARGIEATRNALQEIGEEVYQDPGQRWLCKQLLQRLPAEGNIVIDGLRHPEDHAFMVEKFGVKFIHIHIQAPEQIRRERYIAEGRSEKEFNSAMKHPVEAHVPVLATLAHKKVRNITTKEKFYRSILRAINSIKSEKIRRD